MFLLESGFYISAGIQQPAPQILLPIADLPKHANVQKTQKCSDAGFHPSYHQFRIL